ncbi:MAG: HlyD family secretion protein, partial [Kiloniellales bacterium]|nr:HlyD family secretion protein [Kiloniellales bacterium]
IAPGEPIMHVVPDGDRLLVAARVLPQDIDNIRIGSQTVIRLSAFSQRRTPEVVGQVETVAADSLADEVTGEPYYLALIALPDTLPPTFDDLTLVPGMPAEAFIKTGERSAMSYLLKPLLDSLQRAFREE